MIDRPIFGIELINFLFARGYVVSMVIGGLAYLFPRRGSGVIAGDAITVPPESPIGVNCLQYNLQKAGYTLEEFEDWLHA